MAKASRLGIALALVCAGEICAFLANVAIGNLYLPLWARSAFGLTASSECVRSIYGSLIFPLASNVHEGAIFLVLISPFVSVRLPIADLIGALLVLAGQLVIFREFVREDYGLQHTTLCALASSPIYISLVLAWLFQRKMPPAVHHKR